METNATTTKETTMSRKDLSTKENELMAGFIRSEAAYMANESRSARDRKAIARRAWETRRKAA